MSQGPMELFLPDGVKKEKPTKQKPVGELINGETIVKVNVNKVVTMKERLEEKYWASIQTCEYLLRKSMMIAYSKACDDMLKNMDRNKVE